MQLFTAREGVRGTKICCYVKRGGQPRDNSLAATVQWFSYRDPSVIPNHLVTRTSVSSIVPLSSRFESLPPALPIVEITNPSFRNNFPARTNQCNHTVFITANTFQALLSDQSLLLKACLIPINFIIIWKRITHRLKTKSCKRAKYSIGCKVRKEGTAGETGKPREHFRWKDGVLGISL